VAQVLVAIAKLDHTEWPNSYLTMADSSQENAFVQACRQTSGLFRVEYRDGNTQRQYVGSRRISVEAVKFMFLTYLSGDDESFKHAIDWKDITGRVTSLPLAKKAKARRNKSVDESA
jgi:hypothetical protein